MVPVRAHAGQRVCVLRLTEAGLGAARALQAGGAKVSVWDEDAERCAAAAAVGLQVEDPSTRDWSDLSLLVVGDPSMLEGQVSIRSIEMARSLEIPVVDGFTLLAQACVTDHAATVCAVAGPRSTLIAELVHALLNSIGVDVIGPDLSEAPRAPGPASIVLLPVEEGALPILPDALAITGGSDLSVLAETIDAMTGPVVLDADNASAARLATRAPDRAVLASGRQSLGGGVFVCAGSVFDGYDGPSRRLTGDHPSDGVAFTPAGLLAMAHGIVRALEIPVDRARDALDHFDGLLGWGAPISRFGPIPILNYSRAKDLRSALLALHAPGPVIWIGGGQLETGAAALIEAAGQTPTAVYLPADRRKASKALSRLCPTRIVANIELLAARALFAAIKAGPRARIVIAPGCEDGVDPGQIASALDRLMTAVTEGEAA